ncbi:MAG: hydrolase, partial [Caldithrix sp.]|nr:hydrolase [Caldithrix sp.]
MKTLQYLIIILVISTYVSLPTAKPFNADTLSAHRLSTQVTIDGVLDEAAWQEAMAITNFKQRNPHEGAKPSQRTHVHVLYDDEALYVGARLYDTAPDSIIARLGRRDQWVDADGFGVFIDPYLDRRSGYFFALNAAGTYFDGILLNDDWDDDSWDGVWKGETRIDEQGWTAEFRIPYSQLRFHQKETYKWGINFRRDIKRHNEEDYLVYTPKNESGFVSRFPVINGIKDIDPSRKVELLPYFRTKAEYLQTSANNPFNDGSRYLPAMGIDFKFGIGNNMTLDATINPDFGQVEVDPAVVNLSDVETYYQEKRPFFIEGSSTFRFGRGGSNSFWGFNWGSPNFFYSRRIGRAPAGSLPDHDYADVPDGTRILGAGKLTGKIGNDWNLGTMHAVTSREYAEIEYAGERSQAEVEPL